MKSLKEQIKEDSSIFLDCADFADLHTVEGKEIAIVTDNDRLAELKAGNENALTEADILFYAKTEDLPPKRGYGRMLNFDGKDCFIVYWENNIDIAEIALKRNDEA